jgi:hypothetical protein
MLVRRRDTAKTDHLYIIIYVSEAFDNHCQDALTDTIMVHGAHPRRATYSFVFSKSYFFSVQIKKKSSSTTPGTRWCLLVDRQWPAKVLPKFACCVNLIHVGLFFKTII